jgi:hypothetical protein
MSRPNVYHVTLFAVFEDTDEFRFELHAKCIIGANKHVILPAMFGAGSDCQISLVASCGISIFYILCEERLTLNTLW